MFIESHPNVTSKTSKFFYLVVVFCLGDISADEDDPLKAADPSSPNIQGEPVSIEEVPGETWSGKHTCYIK
jgi:hypothetical protein